MSRKRLLTQAEVESLKTQGCRADDWKKIEVSEKFCADKIWNCRFSGRVVIGTNVYISNIGGAISNYIIEDDAYIENLGELTCLNRSGFGNGVMVAAINESGGREVAIFEGLTAQIAYIGAMYRNRPVLQKALEKMVQSHIEAQSDNMGVVGKGVRITGCGTIDSVRIGEGAQIMGASLLRNGTVCSSSDNQTKIGHSVIMTDFIAAKGASIDSGSIIKRCFIGEAAHVDSGFSAVDSLFFANCDFANGEACSVFAGPYTVSHHKSSLLIAGLFSFFNAGSGTNQSNHLFKTGAVHQAIHERGCKYGSSAYIMAPARTGAFTVILGRHSSHHDTTDFPFSYLLELEEKSVLIPGANLKSYGMVRDVNKWPKRDKRLGEKLDIIDFSILNPYIGERLKRAISISEELMAKDGVEVHNYERVRIKTVMLRRGLALYRSALNMVVGGIMEQGGSMVEGNFSHWVDIAGMYAPYSVVNQLLDATESGKIESLEQFSKEIGNIHSKCGDYAYSWASTQIGKMSAEQAIEQGKKDAKILADHAQNDAVADSGGLMMTGYGIDAQTKQEIEADFRAVRKL